MLSSRNRALSVLVGYPICVLMLLLWFGACGTTHHFVPHQPLEEKEWQISVTWHYDFNPTKPPIIVPELGFYTDVGKNWNVGFGGYLVFPDQATVAKYHAAQRQGDWWRWHASWNQILPCNDNPPLEVGGSYIRRGSTWSYAVGGSMGLATGLSWTPLLWQDSFAEQYRHLPLRLVPSLSCDFRGTDIGLAWRHDFGISSFHTRSVWRESERSGGDAWIRIDASDSTIITVSDMSDWITPDVAIAAADGRELLLWRHYPYPDKWPVPRKRWHRLWGRGYWEWDVRQSVGIPPFLTPTPSRAILNVALLDSLLEANGSIEIRRWPHDTEDRIKNLPSWLWDNSVAISILSHTRRD